jgi:hypothetical protein
MVLIVPFFWYVGIFWPGYFLGFVKGRLSSDDGTVVLARFMQNFKINGPSEVSPLGVLARGASHGQDQR